MYCKKCGAPLDENAEFCPNCGTAANEVADVQDQPKTELGMKWFKFLIYFGLWASGILNALSGATYSSGNYFSGDEEADELIFTNFPSLKPVVIVYGIILVLLGIFIIYTRFALAGYKKHGPICLYAVYGVNVALGIGFPLVCTLITGVNCFTGVIFSIAVSVAMLIINIFYFKNRSHLFVK